jgi:hypothetical protein
MPYLQPYLPIIIPFIGKRNSPFRITHSYSTKPPPTLPRLTIIPEAYGTGYSYRSPYDLRLTSEVAGGRPKSVKHVKLERQVPAPNVASPHQQQQICGKMMDR